MTLNGNRKLIPAPGFARIPSDAQESGVELQDGSSLPVSNADEARLRYNRAEDRLEVSVNGGPYIEIVVAGTGGLVTPTEPGAVGAFGLVDGALFGSDGVTHGGVIRTVILVTAAGVTSPENQPWDFGTGLHSARGGTRTGFTYVTHAMSPYTPTASDSLLLCLTSTGTIQILIPPVAQFEGRHLVVKDWDGNAAVSNITVTPNGAELLNGANASKVLNIARGKFYLFCDGVETQTFPWI